MVAVASDPYTQAVQHWFNVNAPILNGASNGQVAGHTSVAEHLGYSNKRVEVPPAQLIIKHRLEDRNEPLLVHLNEGAPQPRVIQRSIMAT